MHLRSSGVRIPTITGCFIAQAKLHRQNVRDRAKRSGLTRSGAGAHSARIDKENHGYWRSKGATWSRVRFMPDAGLCSEAANERFATKADGNARKRSDFHRIARNRASAGIDELDEIATRNGDFCASVPDQGYRPPAAGGSLRGRDRRGTDRRPVVSVLPPRRHHDHGSRRAAAAFLDRDVFHQFGRSRRRPASRRGCLADMTGSLDQTTHPRVQR